jgi:hypothetical protein
MFEISNHRKSNSDLPIISANYFVLLQDENPIIYTGTNSYGNRILGVIVEESETDFTTRFFHIIISNKQYYAYLEKQIALRDLLIETDPVFVIDFIGGEITQKYSLPTSEIPADYLPLSNSYCPNYISMPSFSYGAALKGKKADLNVVDVHEESEIQNSISVFLKNSLSVLSHNLGLMFNILLQPSMTGSFRINYMVELDSPNLFKPDNKKTADFIYSYLNYILAKLPQEEQGAFDGEEITSVYFLDVANKFNLVMESGNASIKDEEVESELLNSIHNSALQFENITEQIKRSSSFSQIEVVNYQNNNAVGVGLIDKDFYESIKYKAPIPRNKSIEDKIEKDTQYKKYRVRVYDFSSETGKCRAFYYPNENSEYHYKIPIHIKMGDKSTYKNSQYTKSLDSESVVTISAKGERKNGRIFALHTEL